MKLHQGFMASFEDKLYPIKLTPKGWSLAGPTPKQREGLSTSSWIGYLQYRATYRGMAAVIFQIDIHHKKIHLITKNKALAMKLGFDEYQSHYAIKEVAFKECDIVLAKKIPFNNPRNKEIIHYRTFEDFSSTITQQQLYH